jgi:hypothetical protein
MARSLVLPERCTNPSHGHHRRPTSAPIGAAMLLHIPTLNHVSPDPSSLFQTASKRSAGISQYFPGLRNNQKEPNDYLAVYGRRRYTSFDCLTLWQSPNATKGKRNDFSHTSLRTSACETKHSMTVLEKAASKLPNKSESLHGADNFAREYISEGQLASLLNVSIRSIRRWHTLRTGPTRTHAGRRTLYRMTSIEDWLKNNESEAVRR